MKAKVLNYVLASIILISGIAAMVLLYRDYNSVTEFKIVESPKQDEPFAPKGGEDKGQNLAEVDLGQNIALKKRASADFFTQMYIAENVIDGNVKTYWEGAGDLYPNHLTVDLAKVTDIKAARIKLNPSNLWEKRTQTFSVHISDDDKSYEEVIKSTEYVFDPDTGNCVIIELKDIKTRYVRLIFTANTSANAGQVAEFEVY